MKPTTLTTQTVKRLNDLINKPFLYLARPVVVRGYDIKGENVIINTDTDRNIVLAIAQLDQTLDDFLPVEHETGMNLNIGSTALQVIRSDSNTLNDLSKTLMENIDKIKTDDKFIPRAKEINAQANSLIRIAKIKVEMLREMRAMQNHNHPTK